MSFTWSDTEFVDWSEWHSQSTGHFVATSVVSLVFHPNWESVFRPTSFLSSSHLIFRYCMWCLIKTRVKRVWWRGILSKVFRKTLKLREWKVKRVWHASLIRTQLIVKWVTEVREIQRKIDENRDPCCSYSRKESTELSPLFFDMRFHTKEMNKTCPRE